MIKEEVLDTEKLLDSPMTTTELEELEACELQLELAGKDRFEKMLIIGKMLSDIYNKGLFRGPEGGQSWEVYVDKQLPKRLPEAEGRGLDWADRRRVLVEARELLSLPGAGAGEDLPTGTMQAHALKALLPRTREGGQEKWYPLDRTVKPEGLREVWAKALTEAQKQNRANGPTQADISTAREDLRATLEAAGQIRQAPKSFSVGTAASVAAAAERREAKSATVDVSPEQQEADRKRVQQIADQGREEREARAAANQVRQELSESDRKEEERARKWILRYGNALQEALTAVTELERALTHLGNSEGTCYLAELREHPGIVGVNLVAKDLEVMQSIATRLVAARQMAMSNDPPRVCDPETFDAEVV